MKIAQLFILILAFLVITPAKAGVLIEPVLGYNFAKFGTEGELDSATGPSIGGRLGYQNLGFQLGVDYLKSTLDVDNNDLKEDVSMSEWAAFAGFEFPILLRVYAGYIFSATGEADTDGSGKMKVSDGTGMKLGVGFTGLPFVDINFEYRKGTFTETKVGSVKLDDDSEYSSVMVGISLPFVL